MIVKIGSEALNEINLNPETVEEEAAQNVAALALTPRGTVPLLRGMGLEMAFQDKPMPVASKLYEAELSMAVDTWENRAVILSAEGTKDERNGWLMQDMEVQINA